MALPANVKSGLVASSTAAQTKHMTSVKANIANSNNLVRHSAMRQMDEPSPQQARSIDKILRLPR